MFSSPPTVYSTSTPVLTPTHGHSHDQDLDFKRMAEVAARRDVRNATFGYGLHSTALQVKDQHRSRWFYTTVLGMEVVKETEMHDVTMIFLAFPNPVDAEEGGLEFGQRRGLLQLIHVAGTEDDPEFRIRHASPAFCHTCVSVPDLEQAMCRMRSLGVDIVEEGCNDVGYAGIADPDGYSIQLLHCDIDQSIALKRRLEEMMTISSSAESHCRPSSSSSQKRGSVSEIARATSIGSSHLAPSLHGFKGGSPNFEHPHWLSLQGDAALPSVDSFAAPAPAASTQNEPPQYVATSAPAHAGPPSPSLANMTRKEKRGRRLAGSKAHASPEVTGSSSSSSGSSSSGSSSGCSSSNHTTSSAVTSGSSRRFSRASSPGSISRPNAPTSIDLSHLTPVGPTRSHGSSPLAAPQSGSPSPVAAASTKAPSRPSTTTPRAADDGPAGPRHSASLLDHKHRASRSSPLTQTSNSSSGTVHQASADSADGPVPTTTNHSGAHSKRLSLGTPNSFRSLRERLSGKSSFAGTHGR
ncbi:unnamed protein product [Parajaminaea phylloscopi]